MAPAVHIIDDDASLRGALDSLFRSTGPATRQYESGAAFMAGRAHKIYGAKIVDHAYAAGFVLPLVLKDVRLALAEAEIAGAPMPSVNVVHDRLVTGIARGHGGLDWTALGLIAAEEAGLNIGALVKVAAQPDRAA